MRRATVPKGMMVFKRGNRLSIVLMSGRLTPSSMMCVSQITELKAQNFEAEKEMRTKVQSLQKQHSAATDNLQVCHVRAIHNGPVLFRSLNIVLEGLLFLPVSNKGNNTTMTPLFVSQTKIRDLQRQVASLNKSSRKAERSMERVPSHSQLQQLQTKQETQQQQQQEQQQQSQQPSQLDTTTSRAELD